VRAPARCTHYGTDPMVGMLEWVGRQVDRKYEGEEQFSKLRLLIGDISAPRGGCLLGRGGRLGHASHTSGQDADIGFLTPIADRASPEHFHKDFDVKANWYLIKQIFQNPFACVKVIFLDKRLIRKLAKSVGREPEWAHYGRFLRHVRGHNNHMHVRVGGGPGIPGCVLGAHPELEEGDEPQSDSESDAEGLAPDQEPAGGPQLHEAGELSEPEQLLSPISADPSP
jgi:murein endopeptidase